MGLGIQNMFASKPVAEMAPIHAALQGSKKAAIQFQKTANTAVDHAINALVMAQKTPDAKPEAIKAEIKVLRQLKKELRVAPQSLQQANEITVKVGNASANAISHNSNAKTGLDQDIQGLIIHQREFEGHMKDTVNTLKGVAADAFIKAATAEPKPGNLLTRIFNLVKRIFGCGPAKKDMTTISGMANLATELQKTLRANITAMDRFERVNANKFAKLTDVQVKDIQNKITQVRSMIEAERSNCAGDVATLNDSKVKLEADRDRLVNIYTQLKKGEKAGAKQSALIMGREFTGHILAAEEKIAKLDEKIANEETDLAKSYWNSSKEEHRTNIADLQKKKAAALETKTFYEESLKLPSALADNIDNGHVSAAVTLLNTNISNRNSKLQGIEDILKGDLQNVQRLDTLAALEAHMEGIVSDAMRPNPSDTQAVKDWMDATLVHQTGFATKMRLFHGELQYGKQRLV